MKYKNWTLGQVEAVFNKLGGDDGVRRFLAGELVVKQVTRNWPIWKTIKLGTGIKDANGFCQAIKDAKMIISERANDIIRKPEFTVANQEMEVDLVKVTVDDLGLDDHVRLDQTYDRAKSLGLELCPAEVGPQLRLQYIGNLWIIVGMKPIRNSGDELSIFGVEYNTLYSFFGNPDADTSANEWVFVLPRK